mmetsp:Transcript_7055/g.13898  ORF Transcript_7055/g.13898 Transcript_7055/m.13898 type:complete len:298 (-) Transcript_7055:370-1263(-)
MVSYANSRISSPVSRKISHPRAISAFAFTPSAAAPSKSSLASSRKAWIVILEDFTASLAVRARSFASSVMAFAKAKALSFSLLHSCQYSFFSSANLAWHSAVNASFCLSSSSRIPSIFESVSMTKALFSAASSTRRLAMPFWYSVLFFSPSNFSRSTSATNRTICRDLLSSSFVRSANSCFALFICSTASRASRLLWEFFPKRCLRSFSEAASSRLSFSTSWFRSFWTKEIASALAASVSVPVGAWRDVRLELLLLLLLLISTLMLPLLLTLILPPLVILVGIILEMPLKPLEFVLG